VFVAGIYVRDKAILELARLVDDPDLATRLDENYSRGTKVLALTPNARRSSRRSKTRRRTSQSSAVCCSGSLFG
jgi:hypothetical protein